jgi:hypothetical protein
LAKFGGYDKQLRGSMAKIWAGISIEMYYNAIVNTTKGNKDIARRANVGKSV